MLNLTHVYIFSMSKSTYIIPTRVAVFKHSLQQQSHM